MKNYNELMYWMKERESVRRAKERGDPKPWSTDHIFHHTYFCNVHREDDKVTRWIRENWRLLSTVENHLVAMAVARLVNKPESLAKLGYPYKGFDFHYCHKFVEYMSTANKPWGSAYIVSTNGRSMPKAQYIATVLQALEQHKGGVPYSSLALCHGFITGLQGFGSFMSAQIVADLKNTRGHPLVDAPDWWDWCAHGPGSLRGMAWVYGRKKVTPTEFYLLMPPLLERVRTEDKWEIHAQDLQNALCEFDKFMRVKLGTGRSKRKYDGT